MYPLSILRQRTLPVGSGACWQLYNPPSSRGWSGSLLPGRGTQHDATLPTSLENRGPLELGAAPVLEVGRQDGGLGLAAVHHSNLNTYASPSLRPDTVLPLWNTQYVTRVAMRISAMYASRSRARSRESREHSLGRKLRPTRARHPRHSNSTGGPLRSACTAALLAPAVPQTTRTCAPITAAPRLGRPRGILPCRMARAAPRPLSVPRRPN